MMGIKETKKLLFYGAAIFPALCSAEITIALLRSVPSNAEVNLLYRNSAFACPPVGVTPLEKLPFSAPDPQGCRVRVEAFMASSPEARTYGARHLHTQQSYRFERIAQGCVLYANGPESYSEMLLKEGLALIDPVFDHREWNYRLKRAQTGAEKMKKGVHGTDIKAFCIKEEKEGEK